MHYPSSAWEMVLQNLEEGIVAFDRDMRASNANKAALKLLGLHSIKGFRGIKERLFDPEIWELAISGVEVLNAPLAWTVPGGDEVNLLCSLIPVVPEGEREVQEVILILKPGTVSSAPPVESWLEWGRKYLNQVTSNLHEAICYLDREGRIIYANRNFEELAGGEFSAISGRPLPSVLKPVSRPLFLMEVIEKTSREGSWQGKFEIRTGGGIRSLSATAAKIRSDEGLDLGMAIMARDITEWKLLERKMQWRDRELSLVYELLHLTANYHDVGEALRETLSRILPIMRAEAGAVYMRGRETDDLRLVAYKGLAYRSAKDLASGWEGINLIEEARANPEGVIVDQGPEESGPGALLGRRGPLRSLAAVPICSSSMSAGVLMVGHSKSSRFNGDDLPALLSLASQVRMVFELAGLLEDLHAKLEELGRERDLSRALVDTMPSALALLDDRGRLAYINQRFTELLGYLQEEAEGQPFTILLPPGERKKTMADIMTRERIGSAWREIELVDKWGETIPVLVTSASRPFEGGEYRGAIVTVTDLSQQRVKEKEARESEDTAKELSDELAGARDSLERLDIRKQAYLSMVYHEVMAPLKLMRQRVGDLGRELDKLPPEEARRRLKWLGQEVNRLERMASDIQDMSAAEKGTLRLRRREVEMREITSRVVEEMRPAGDNPIAVELPKRPVTGRVDAGRLEQVLAGLIDNAMKYSTEGSEVKVKLIREKDRAFWEVEDKGAGMDPRQVRNLLDLFAGKGKPEMEVTTGLSLFICHHIVQAHGGNLGLESAPGHGTKVYFTIPLESKR